MRIIEFDKCRGMVYNHTMKYFDYLGQFLFLGTRVQGNAPSLDGTRALLHAVGNPHNTFKSIHVAGTNGKGSVVETIYSILRAEGYKVGKHISPYLTRFNEYFSVDGVDVADDEIEGYLSQLKPIIKERQDAGLVVTYFEIVVTMVYMHFAKYNVDVAVVEVGLGGTYDCTNVLEPIAVTPNNPDEIKGVVATAITQIHFDHKEVLGMTIEEIASNKAGIIKHGVPAVTYNEDSALQVIQNKATLEDAPLTTIIKHDIKTYPDGNFMTVEYGDKTYLTSLKGHHQGYNTLTAIKTLETVANILPVSKSSIEMGLRNVVHKARFETIYDNVVFDGAHNSNSLCGFMHLIGDYYPAPINKKFIVAMLGRKDPDDAMEQLAKMDKHTEIVFTGGPKDNLNQYNDAETLVNSWKKFSDREFEVMAWDDALQHILDDTPQDTAHFIVGSFKTYKYAVDFLNKKF